MSKHVVNPASAKELKKLLSALAAGMRDTLASLTSRNVTLTAGGLEVAGTEDVLAGIDKPNAVVRGALDKEYTGKTVCTLFEVQDAAAMAGMLLMAPAETIEQRRGRLSLESEDIEAFREVGNMLCTGYDAVLQKALPGVGLKVQDTGVIKPGSDSGKLLPEGELLCLRFQLTVADHPATTGLILLDRATAEKWNKAPVTFAAPPAQGEAKVATPAAEDDEGIPQAPIRGVLNAFLANPDLMPLVRQSCRRVGLELRRWSKTDIPNPAAHRGEIVLIDVPLGDERRFDWCKRIKGFESNVRVVLLIHRPSRARVVQGFLSDADVLLGLPADEAMLSQKLKGLLEGAVAT